MREKEITITVNENIASELADILCYFAGVFDSKGEEWKNRWLMDSVEKVRQLKIDIQDKLKP